MLASSALFNVDSLIDSVETTLNNMLFDAIQKNASDIHIEPMNINFRIRFRIDGILYNMNEQSQELALRMIVRLKIMANLDLSEKRLPQDGHFNLDYRNKTWDFRISSCAHYLGEKIVLRLLQNQTNLLDVDTIGLELSQKEMLLPFLNRSQGLILVCGPTGSGKTNSLYSLLHFLDTEKKNIVTIEDPVEINLAGINQINIQPKIGLTFSTLLKTILRQDPDVIMIGEIRDLDTANIAIQAAQTGHLVLATLHASNTIQALQRLLHLGISLLELSYTLSCIISQRLIRKLCDYCKLSETTFKNPFNSEDNFAIYNPQNCSHCRSGYRGRTGLFECLINEKTVQKLIANQAIFSLADTLTPTLFSSFKQTAICKLRRGITSLKEIKSVITL